MSVPSEAFGLATTTHLGSVLAWAAVRGAVRSRRGWPEAARARRRASAAGPGRVLRACPRRRCAGTRAEPAGRTDRDAAPRDESAAGGAEAAARARGVRDAMARAGGVSTRASRCRPAGSNPRRLPLPFIAGHVWTIVIVRESAQRTEIHRYLQRLEPLQPFDDTIRLVEQSWRALEARTPLYDDEAARLLERDLDPLSLAVLGYRLALESRWPEVDDIVTAARGRRARRPPRAGSARRRSRPEHGACGEEHLGAGRRRGVPADGGVADRRVREAEHAAADRARAVHRRTVDDVRHARPGRDLEGVPGAQRPGMGDATARRSGCDGANRVGPGQPGAVHRHGLPGRTTRTRVDGLPRAGESHGRRLRRRAGGHRGDRRDDG